MANIVITGSTKGIGLGLAREFARGDHQVLIAGSHQASIDDALHTLKNCGTVYGKVADVRDFQQVQALWDEAQHLFGSVDIWINNAGLARTVWSIVDTPHDEVQAMITTNMLGTINGSKVAASGMLQQGHGKIFNMLGGGSDGETFPGMGIYGSTKRGLDYFTNALVKELKDTPVIVAKIRPGMIITEGVIREAKADFDNFQKSRKMMNNLVDTVETVAPWLVEQILATTKSGHKIRWLNGKKIAIRMLKSRIKARQDQFEAFGL
ncbi:3-alpha-hydroxycholanate dehydrogenase (NADP(+)) [Zhongshania aliphaticivorans]|uniref:3-alpha-hydroxycholanate dehydrogenase (NADP(+)) n=1 Tax=Zhongshania aliphaticivorans TaxID=1470434 RepID=A0A5S9N5H3_9GAMM|nr:SDR family oxidoreductase [Zhongshania aliphaticivorans]CAA0081258.1 3-alpha-hydroxycholanate dehydrogenase (NADP(+)) [Zhongshania aliphaticivorans]CAA0085020.1 3-alpha-hydroxycholanate dehydrogenase (NADP(+)) [Zhongshania aliphaticivorans]